MRGTAGPVFVVSGHAVLFASAAFTNATGTTSKFNVEVGFGRASLVIDQHSSRARAIRVGSFSGLFQLETRWGYGAAGQLQHRFTKCRNPTDELNTITLG